MAIKFIDKRKLGDKQRRDLQREIAAMQALGGHPHVVRLLEVNNDATFPAAGDGDDDAGLNHEPLEVGVRETGRVVGAETPIHGWML